MTASARRRQRGWRPSIEVPGIYGWPLRFSREVHNRRKGRRRKTVRVVPWLLPGATAPEISAWLAGTRASPGVKIAPLPQKRP